MALAWRSFWVVIGGMGTTALFLGLIQTYNEQGTGCEGGSQYAPLWLTISAVLLGLSLTALIAHASARLTPRTLNLLSVGLLAALGLSVVCASLIGNGVFELPWLEKQDVPVFGQGVMCAA